jgi:hypothetical protein
MKRVWGHVLSGVLLLGGATTAVASFPGCVHDNSTLFVADVLAPQFVTAGMACTFTADPTQPVLAEGTMDVGLTSEYNAELLVGNQIVPRGDPTQPHTETSIISVEGAVVTITDSTGAQLSSFTARAAGTIPPSSGTTPGFASLSVTIVDSATASTLVMGGGTGRIVSTVRFFGHTLGGESVESNDFGFPIDVCTGCLVNFPTASEITSLPTPNCANANASAAGGTTNVPCVTGQDLAIDCAACQQFKVCQGVGAGVAAIVDAGSGG